MAHLCVIGAGVIGLSVAYYCARAGHAVTIVDRQPARRDGCSFGNAGMVVPSHFTPLAAPGMVGLALKWMFNPESPFYLQPRLDPALWSWAWHFWRSANAGHVRRCAPLIRDLSLGSRAAFIELASRPDHDFGLVRAGLLMLCQTEAGLEEERHTAEAARKLGLPAEVLDAAETARRDPGVTMSVAGSVYFPQDCHLSPGRFMAVLQRELEQQGAAFRWETQATGWRRTGRRLHALLTVSQGTPGEIVADEFVVCGGSWSPEVAAGLGLKLPMQAGKGYSLTLPQPRELPHHCAIFTEARVAVTPMGDSLRFGGTMEIAGLNERINPARIQGIVKAVSRYYPNYRPEDFAGIQPWRGLRPCSPDGMPYLGRTSRLDNLVLATGHAMMGLSLAPITGQLVAEILSGYKPSHDLTLLAPDRFG